MRRLNEKQKNIVFILFGCGAAVLFIMCICMKNRIEELEWQNYYKQEAIDRAFMEQLGSLVIDWNEQGMTENEIVCCYSEDVEKLHAALALFDTTSYSENRNLYWIIADSKCYLNDMIRKRQKMTGSVKLYGLFWDVMNSLKEGDDESITACMEYIQSIHSDEIHSQSGFEVESDDLQKLDISAMEMTVTNGYIQAGEVYFEVECKGLYRDFENINLYPQVYVGDQKLTELNYYDRRNEGEDKVIYSFVADISSYNIQNSSVVINEIIADKDGAEGKNKVNYIVNDKKGYEEVSISGNIVCVDGTSISVDRIVFKDEAVKIKGKVTLANDNCNMAEYMIKAESEEGGIYAFAYEYKSGDTVTWRLVRNNSLMVDLNNNPDIDWTVKMKYDAVK